MANSDDTARRPRPASGEPSAEQGHEPALVDGDVQVALIGDLPDGGIQSGAAPVDPDQGHPDQGHPDQGHPEGGRAATWSDGRDVAARHRSGDGRSSTLR